MFQDGDGARGGWTRRQIGLRWGGTRGTAWGAKEAKFLGAQKFGLGTGAPVHSLSGPG